MHIAHSLTHMNLVAIILDLIIDKLIVIIITITIIIVVVIHEANIPAIMHLNISL